MPIRRALALLLAALAAPAFAADRPDPADWPAVEAAARGQQVWFHAWGGDPRRNDYIAWAADEVEARYGVTVTQVKLADTGEAVARVAAEKAAGRDAGGAVDLVWINGPNFAAMKEGGLLFGPWAEALPNWRHVDVAGKPTVVNDFTVPTEGLEAPWGMAQIVFYHDTARLPNPPRSIAALGTWAAAHPGRFTYPQPPDFLGLTFLKQAAFALVPDTAALQEPVDEARYAELTRPLWAWLDRLAPDLWRGGRAYPLTGTTLKQLMADGEIDLAFSFNQSEASAAIANGELPETVRSYVLEGGTIGNADVSGQSVAQILALLTAELADKFSTDTVSFPDSVYRHKADCESRGVQLAFYELGQHLEALANQTWTAAVSQLFVEVNRDAGMKTFMAAYLAECTTALGSGTNPLLADVAMSDPAMQAAIDADPGAEALANAIAQAVASASGLATFYRATDSDGLVVWQGTTGTVDEDLVFDDAGLVQSAPLSGGSVSLFMPES